MTIDCERCGSPVSIFDALTDGELSTDGQPRRVCVPCAERADAKARAPQGVQTALFNPSPIAMRGQQGLFS